MEVVKGKDLNVLSFLLFNTDPRRVREVSVRLLSSRTGTKVELGWTQSETDGLVQS